MKKMMLLLPVCSLCLLFAGCSSEAVSMSEQANTVVAMEEGLPKLPELEPVVEDSWPERIGREDNGMTAEKLSFEITLSEQEVLSVACVTQSGRLDIEIAGEDGETFFCENNIQTETFEVPINAPGTYKVIVHAEEHTGSFWIEPQE